MSTATANWDLAQLIVLDGNDPSQWTVWNQPFPAIKKKCDSLNIVLPTAISGRRQLRFEVLPHPFDDLKARTTWSAVVGALVDGANPTVEQRERHQVTCRALTESDTALYRTAGYHLLVINALDPTQQQVNFVRDLALDASDILGDTYVQHPHEVFGVDTLLAAFRFSVQRANNLAARRALQ